MEQLEEVVNSLRLSDYSDELRDETMNVIFSAISKGGRHAFSHLFTDGNPYLEENRRVIARSQRMKEKFLNQAETLYSVLTQFNLSLKIKIMI